MGFQAVKFPKELEQLQEAGVRVSKQRLQILSYLNRLDGRHLTVEHMFREMSQEKDFKLSVATVYNTINLFCEKGLIRSVEYPGETARYDRRMDAHAHFFCRNCGTIHDLPAPGFERNEWEGFVVEEAQVLLSGLCADCSKRIQQGSQIQLKHQEALSGTKKAEGVLQIQV